MNKSINLKDAALDIGLKVPDDLKSNFEVLIDKLDKILKNVESGVITSDSYESVIDGFVSMLDDSGLCKEFSEVLIYELFRIGEFNYERKANKIRKPKGAYSVPDKVIDGVIKNIVYGEKVLDACDFAGISTVTLYSRIRDRGYDDIKEFFKEQRRKMMEVK